MTYLAVLGTRPDTIKMAPVITALRRRGAHVTICLSGQHADLVKPALRAFGLHADVDLGLPAGRAGLGALTGGITMALAGVIDRRHHAAVLVHGDTTTALAAAQAAYLTGVPVAHIEAGLRTGDFNSPWPEEMHRVLISRLAHLHFAPTRKAEQNLRGEGVRADRIHVTGNTSIDALSETLSRLGRDHAFTREALAPLPKLRGNAALILATLHRRETQGEGQADVCRALRTVAGNGDVDLVMPVHPNPKVSEVVFRELGGSENIHLLPPLGYPAFAWLMKSAAVIVTDSGGIQEEATWLGTPLLIARETTERSEAVDSGAAELVGTDPARIGAALVRSLTEQRRPPSSHHLFGDGRAAQRISDVLLAA